MQNPFKPTAGATPPDLVGRAGLLDEFEYGLRQGSGAPGLLTIITGARGIGKTVMLSAAEEIARNHGWAVISRTANPGFLAKIGDDMLRLLDELGDGPPARKITAFSAAGFGLTTQLPGSAFPTGVGPERSCWACCKQKVQAWSSPLTRSTRSTARKSPSWPPTCSISSVKGCPSALSSRGSSAVSDLLNEGVATFLRRADRINLHEAAITEVTASYRELFSRSGIDVSHAHITEAAEATEGYPFLIQLVGYYLWMEADKAGWTLNEENVQMAIAASQRRNTLVVVESALSDISEKDRAFLDAMAEQDGASTAAQIGQAIGSKPNVVSKYRNRLIAAGLIESAGYGKVDFAIPGLRQYLRS
ncbi:ATP-binding protein [Arthrobacter sp. OVS8]|nr:ATP-binding protein [Arthrobacter sp. OVS8]